jgi:amidase
MPDFRSPTELTPEISSPGIGIAEASAAGLRQALARGELTATALTQACLDRITAVNPALRAVIAVSPDALEQAAASEAAWRAGQPRSPLEGIPVLVKDNVQVAGQPATAGSSALLSARPPDAFVVSRLRAAGAVIVAKANLSEWANFRSTRSTSGWSTVGGQTANPYALNRNPSGSSSGSAAGLSAGFAPLAVGTETDGSIVSPSSACGVVGVKPTLGLVSRTGIVPISLAQDTAGPMATSVTDAAALLSVLAGADPEDSAADHPGETDYAGFLDAGSLEGARIGIWRAASAGADTKTEALLDQAVDCLRKLGAVVIDPVELPDIEKVTEPEFEALNYEFKYWLNSYLKYLAAFACGDDSGPPGTLADLIDYNQRNAGAVLARFGQEIFQAAEATSGDLGDPVYLELRGAASQLARTAVETPTVEHRLDAIFSLTANPAWLTDYVLGDHSVFGTSRPGAVSGWPSVSVPFGFIAGLPVGVSFLGPRWSEPRLLALAYAFEQATQSRRLPEFRPTVLRAGHGRQVRQRRVDPLLRQLEVGHLTEQVALVGEHVEVPVPVPRSAVRMTLDSPLSAHRFASSITAAMACDGSGAGMIPSAFAKVTAAAKHSRCALATASNRPSSYMWDSNGDMPW